MEAFARPLRRLLDDAAWFVRARELRLLWVKTSAGLRGTVLDVLMGLEAHADNDSLFVCLEDGWDEWKERVARLDEQVSARAQLPSGTISGEASAAGFATALASQAARVRGGLTVILAPLRIDDANAFTAEVRGLVQAGRLEGVRWIVVESETAHLAGLASEARHLACPCGVDDDALAEDLSALAASWAPRGPWHAWRSAGAMPDAEPPPRRDLPPAPDEQTLREAGLSPGFVQGGGQRLRELILGAARAFKQGDGVAAVTFQTEAANLCGSLEMPREQVVSLMVLGGYALALNLRERARTTWENASSIAARANLADQQAQAELSLGMLAVLDSNPGAAAAHYARAARVAEQGQSPGLAIECWRTAGQLAADHEVELSAVECWKRALTLADALEPTVAASTSADEVALALAHLCRKRGLDAQADSLERQSARLEGTV